jgi:hypothetical protein
MFVTGFFASVCFVSGVVHGVDHGSHNETECEEGGEGTEDSGNEESPESPGEDHAGTENSGEEDDFFVGCHVVVISFAD